MKKTIIALIALSPGFAVAGDSSTSLSLHEVIFSAPQQQALHNAFSTNADANSANMYLSGQAYYTNDKKGTTYDGIYLASDSGLKFNHGTSITVSHLYIASNIIMKKGTDFVEGQLNWSNTNDSTKLKISEKVGSWVDINADYGIGIDISAMTDGALYLNTGGALTLQYTSDNKTYTDYTLANGVDVYATITDEANVRTLLTGDFSNWSGTVYLMTADNTVYNGSNYTWKATAEGLEIVTIPEPTTATLSLLALAGLAARRRRK